MEFFKNILPKFHNYNDDLGNKDVTYEPVKEILEGEFEHPTTTIRGEPIDPNKPKRIFRYASDIHLEMRKFLQVPSMDALKPLYQFEKEPNTRYFLALVGDIGSPFVKSQNLREFFELCSQAYEYVFFVMGNHEYYNNGSFTMEEVHSELKSMCSEFNNVILLENESFQLDEYKIVGTTLWSNVQINPQHVERCLNDYRLIKTYDLEHNDSNGLKSRRIKIEDTNKLHEIAIDFLKKEIFEDSNPTKSPCIVLTHHAPQFNDHKRGLFTSHPNYTANDPIGEAFSTNLSNFLKKPVVAYIFGHTHFSTRYKYNGVSILANQYGYEFGEDLQSNKFNPNRYFIL
ncbi:hypothetical protein DICPUDRAFT_37878 [Dictyostelium purpureum]|uniref:Calcineurin-like phosphoesterase domain-containing protein n=1 Tax=Dictyostelium purpureum TaxID=5786 RepID=F0ZTJ7_DICPU|nr:uncharacterized protein DICPUDRAFT_37878 [Dictyostelium purpureum]EGC32736.1 hypothetical protein DICPUDRAFT_37878 [Dictyostelium purpureum]|eukprot:XP_003290734.1 hypothetical protein DICPUDRAFT_37878 [Dictyostelium purpureum]